MHAAFYLLGHLRVNHTATGGHPLHVTGPEIAAVTRAYRVYYAKAERKDATQYLMDHSSFIYLIGPDGKLRGLYRPGSTAQELTAALRTRLAGK